MRRRGWEHSAPCSLNFARQTQPRYSSAYDSGAIISIYVYIYRYRYICVSMAGNTKSDAL